jgi:hypothetical protein
MDLESVSRTRFPRMPSEPVLLMLSSMKNGVFSLEKSSAAKLEAYPDIIDRILGFVSHGILCF